MTVDVPLNRGRESFESHAWRDAYAQLLAAAKAAPLEVDDLERAAVAAFLIGRDAESADLRTRAFHECLRLGHPARAARSAFWMGFALLNAGELAPGLGWMSRAGRLLEEARLDCVERGYLLLPVALRSLGEGDTSTAYETFRQAVEVAERFGDRDLLILAQHGCGRVLMQQGEIAKGLALLDEVMVAVTAGEASPIVVGTVYCSVIEACKEIFDLRRAREWTAALTAWCESQPDLVPYRGQCLVYRAEIMRLHGAWPDAIEEAERACERLAEPAGQPAVGAALYERAELHRLRGEFAKAEEAYRRASHAGHASQPGLAQLRLAQGHVAVAEAAIRRMLEEARDRVTRSRVLPVYVEILLAAKDIVAARAAANELAQIASDAGAPFLRAVSAHANGAVLLGEGDAKAALAELRPAWTAWRELEAPYEAARVRVLAGLACRALGDEDGAEMEFDAARSVFQQLGASADLAHAEELSRPSELGTAGGLTAREVQVLALVATGKTNRAIAAELVISEKTVARHVSNIFTKLGVSSRAAATAYAYEHELV